MIRPEDTCKYPYCQKTVRARGLCSNHYELRREKEYVPCGVAGCWRQATTRGMCPGHYAQWKQGRPLRPLREKTRLDKTCRMKDCELVPVAKGICSKHYSRAQRKRYRLSIPVEEIIAAVESGKTQREIAKKYHVSRMVIASRLKAVGYQSPNAGPRPKLNTEEALQVIEQYGITEAARRLEVSTGAVQSLLDRKQIARFTTVPTQRRGLEAEEIRKLHALHSKIPEKNSGLDLHSMEAGEFFSYCLQLHARNVPMSRMSEELNHARSWITNSLHKLGRAPVPRKVDSLTTQARKKRASRNP